MFASNATEVSLCLFTEDDLLKGEVTLEIPLDPEENRTGDVWHVAVQSIDADLLYAYRVSGTEYDGTCMTAGLAYAPVRVFHFDFFVLFSVVVRVGLITGVVVVV